MKSSSSASGPRKTCGSKAEQSGWRQSLGDGEILNAVLAVTIHALAGSLTTHYRAWSSTPSAADRRSEAIADFRTERPRQIAAAGGVLAETRKSGRRQHNRRSGYGLRQTCRTCERVTRVGPADGPGPRRPASTNAARGTRRRQLAVIFEESLTPAVNIWCSDFTNRHQKMWRKAHDVRQQQRLPGVSKAGCAVVRYARLPH